jgi:hypothetical protein
MLALAVIAATLFIIDRLHRPPADTPPPAEKPPTSGQDGTARRVEILRQLRGLLERKDRFASLAIRHEKTGKHIIFLWDSSVLFLYVPCKNLDAAARTRALDVLRALGGGRQLGNHFVAKFYDEVDAEQVTEATLRIFDTVYQLGADYQLVIKGNDEPG